MQTAFPTRPRRRGGRAWYRAHFVDHPLYESRDPRALTPGRSALVKVWCQLCLDARVNDVFHLEAKELAQGERATVRERADIAAELWDAPDAGWIPSDTSRCLVHLRDCRLQLHDVRERARAQKEAQNHSRRVPEDAPWTAPAARSGPSPHAPEAAVPAAPVLVPNPHAAVPFISQPGVVVVSHITYAYQPHAESLPYRLPSPVEAGYGMPPHPQPGWQGTVVQDIGGMNVVQNGIPQIGDRTVSWGVDLPPEALQDPQFWQDLERLFEDGAHDL